MTTTVVAVETAVAIPPLVGRQGIASMLGVPFATVKDWRNKWLRAQRDDSFTSDFPPHDRYIDDRPFWKPRTIIAWAVATGRIPRDHGIVLGPDIDVWCQLDVAKYFGVDLETVRDRWMHWYTYYSSRKLPIPAKAMAKPDFMVDKTPFWIPATALEWGQQTGKLGRDLKPLPRSGNRWGTEPDETSEPVDQVQTMVDEGQLLDHQAIAVMFGVKVTTVKMWGSPHSSGKGFPAPDGPSKLDLSPTWYPPTVLAWATETGRADADGSPLRAVGGRPRK